MHVQYTTVNWDMSRANACVRNNNNHNSHIYSATLRLLFYACRSMRSCRCARTIYFNAVNISITGGRVCVRTCATRRCCCLVRPRFQAKRLTNTRHSAKHSSLADLGIGNSKWKTLLCLLRAPARAHNCINYIDGKRLGANAHRSALCGCVCVS